MATLSLVLGQNTTTKSFPDADGPRLREAWRIRLGMPEGTTTAALSIAISEWVFNEIISEEWRQNREQTAKAAVEDVPPIPLT